MGFEVAPDPGDRGEPDVKLGRTGGSTLGEDRRVVTDGAQVLSRGALVCPRCELPISPRPRIRPGAELRCGFCEHSAAAIEFLREDVYDTVGNEAILVARLA